MTRCSMLAIAVLLPKIGTAQQPWCQNHYSLSHFIVDLTTASDRNGRDECGASASTTVDGDTVRRIFRDGEGKPYFGYELRIAAGGEHRYRLVEMGPVAGQTLRELPFEIPRASRRERHGICGHHSARKTRWPSRQK